MTRLRVLLKRLAALVGRHRGDVLDEEIQTHLQLLADDYERRGLSRDKARLAARRDFGGVTQVREAWRDLSTFVCLDNVACDVRYAIRALRRAPSFTITAVGALTIATAAILLMTAVAKAVLFAPLPFRDIDGLTVVWTGPAVPQPTGRAAYGTVEEWRRQLRSFEGLAVADPGVATLTDADGAERVSTTRVSPNVFPLLGLQPLKGRVFSQLEAERRESVGLIGYRFWQQRFAGSPAAVGASIVIDGRPVRIVGVLPPHIEPFDRDVWQPDTLAPDWDARRAAQGAGPWFVFARLRPDVTIAQAQAEMTISAVVHDAAAAPAERLQGATVTPFSTFVVPPNTRLALWILVGAAIGVWLIAVVNVTNLSLARTIGRAPEIAIRTALGAGMGGIARQLTIEHLTLAATSAVFAWTLLFLGVPLIRTFGPDDVARLDTTAIDGSVLLLAVVLPLATGLLISIGPIAAARWRRSVFARQTAGTANPSIVAVRSALVTVEVALAMVLLGGAGLLARSWWGIVNVDPGFQSARVLFVNLQAPPSVSSAARGSFWADVLARVRAVPGVKSAALIGDLFVTNDDEHVMTAEGGVADVRMRIRHDEASGDIFSTLGTPLRRGRSFSDADRADGPRVSIVNETFARRLWSERDPIGHRFKIGPESPWFTVIGVVADIRREDLWTAPIPQMFVPLQQDPSGREILLVKTALDEPMTAFTVVRDAIRRLDKNTTVAGTSLDALRRDSLAQRRLQTGLLLGSSIVALLLASIGIYGLSHYVIVSRAREIGIRIAIGAQAGTVVRSIVMGGFRVTMPGMAVGLIGAWLLGRVGSAMLFGVSPTDPVTFFVVSALLLCVGALATWLPARRITKIDPAAVLKCE